MVAFRKPNLGKAIRLRCCWIPPLLCHPGLFAGLIAYPEIWVTEGDHITWGVCRKP